ncbi:hypothetical protein L9F63_002146, partial [Diploptera punctata]
CLRLPRSNHINSWAFCGDLLPSQVSLVLDPQSIPSRNYESLDLFFALPGDLLPSQVSLVLDSQSVPSRNYESLNLFFALPGDLLPSQVSL